MNLDYRSTIKVFVKVFKTAIPIKPLSREDFKAVIVKLRCLKS